MEGNLVWSEEKRVGSNPTTLTNLIGLLSSPYDLQWWHWCSGSIKDCESLGTGSLPVCHPKQRREDYADSEK